MLGQSMPGIGLPRTEADREGACRMILDLCYRSQELMSALWEGDAEAFLAQAGSGFGFVSPITDPLDDPVVQVEAYCVRARRVSDRLSCTILDAQCTHRTERTATILCSVK